MISISIVVFSIKDGTLVYLSKSATTSGKLELPRLSLPLAVQLDLQTDQWLTQLFQDTRFYRKQIRAFVTPENQNPDTTVFIGYYAMTIAQALAQKATEKFQWTIFKRNSDLPEPDREILQAAHRRLLAKMSSQLAGFEMISENFTLKQLQELYEIILGHELDKRNFRRKILRFEVIQETGSHQQPWNESGKAPMLYKLDREKYDSFRAAGGTYSLS